MYSNQEYLSFTECLGTRGACPFSLAGHGYHIINLADKTKASWLAIKEYQTKELVSDSEDKKRIKKVQERALKQKNK